MGQLFNGGLGEWKPNAGLTAAFVYMRPTAGDGLGRRGGGGERRGGGEGWGERRARERERGSKYGALSN